MSDALLAETDREEALSVAYVHAIAAGAGYVVAKDDYDRDGIDLQIRAGGNMRPCLDLQLKATVNLGCAKDGLLRYPLKRRNYDLLRQQCMVPRILVVLALPENKQDWIAITPEALILRRCAFWVSLAGSPDTENCDSITVSIPASNYFDVSALRDLMNKSRRGVIS
ncbi:MAG: DUF4365 domain-containing protein [Burkholderiaceae bacterium]